MKIAKFVPEYDPETNRWNWSMEIVADGRVWQVEGCTTGNSHHTVGRIQSKSNRPYGIHYESQLAKQIREYVIEQLDAEVERSNRIFERDLLAHKSMDEPDYQHPVLGLETRAVLAHLVEELQAEFFTREVEAREAHYEMTHLEATAEYSAARGFESAIEYLMGELQSITRTNKQVKDIVSKRRVCEFDPEFRGRDLVLNAIDTTQSV